MKLSDAVEILKRTMVDMAELSASEDLSGTPGPYWMVPHGKVFDMENVPENLEVGDMCEDFRSVVERMRNNEVIYPDSLLLLSAMMRLAYEKAGK